VRRLGTVAVRRASAQNSLQPLLLFAVSVLWPAAPAAAASFNCAKASTPVETMICGDPALSAADEALAAIFAEALAATLDPQPLRTEQREWMRQRNKLAKTTDLAAAYRDRTDALKAEIGSRQAMPRDIAEAEAGTACFVLPEAAADLTCEVAETGAVEDDKGGSLRYQLQGYKQDDLRIAGGAILFEPVAGKPGRLAPIAAAYGESAHYGRPKVVTAAVATFLLIPGSIDGTGNFSAESLFLIDDGKLRDVDVRSWQRDLERRLPKDMAPWKGIYPDYAKLTAGTALWQDGDANCCPTAGYATIRLGLKGQRLTLEQVAVKRGAAAANADQPPADKPADAATHDDADLSTDLCGKAMVYEINEASFKDGPAAGDKQAVDTAQAKAPLLVHRAFKELCMKKTMAATDVAARIDKVVISWAGGADDFTAYFPDKKKVLMTEWVWTGTESPSASDVRTGILCAFKPKQKACRDRGP
jgi:uncharacterized protein YecT (DUF1311 family)